MKKKAKTKLNLTRAKAPHALTYGTRAFRVGSLLSHKYRAEGALPVDEAYVRQDQALVEVCQILTEEPL